jgi:hypothetical protein
MASRDCIGVDDDDADGVDMMSVVDGDAVQDSPSGTDACRGKLVMRVDKFNRSYIQ